MRRLIAALLLIITMLVTATMLISVIDRSIFLTDILSWGPKVMLGAPIPVTWIAAFAAIVLVAAYLRRPYRPRKVREGEYVLSIPDTKRSPWLPPPVPPQNPHMDWAQQRFREYLEREAYRPKVEEEEMVIMIKPPPSETQPPNQNPPQAEARVERAPEEDDSIIVVLPSQPQEPTIEQRTQLMQEGGIEELTADLLERLSNEAESPDRMRRLIAEGRLRPRIEGPPLLGREKELKDVERLILGGGHLAIVGSSLDRRLIVERAFRDLELGYVMGEAEPQAAQFVKSILPKELRGLEPEEALTRLARKGVTHIVVDEAERMEDPSSLLRLAFPASMNIILLCRSLPSPVDTQVHRLGALSQPSLGWIAFGKALHRGILLEREAEQALVNEASREGKPEIIQEVVERIPNGSAASVQEALEEIKAGERTTIIESLDEGCKRFYEYARGLKALGEEDYTDLFNKCHAGLGVETSRKHYEEAMGKLERMGFERKTLNALPVENLLALASGKLDGTYLLNGEAVERASEYYASPEPIVEALRRGALVPRVEGRMVVQRSSRLEPIMGHLRENQSLVLLGEPGSGRKTCLEEALKKLRIRYLSGDASGGIATFLTQALKELGLEARASDRGRPTLEDHLEMLHKVKEGGFSYLVVFNVGVGWRVAEAVEKLVRACFAAGLNVLLTCAKPIEIEGLEIVEHHWSGQTFDWCVFAKGLERELILERDARRMLMDYSRGRRNLATAAKILEKVKSGRPEDIEPAIKELEPGEEAEAREVEEIIGEGSTDRSNA